MIVIWIIWIIFVVSQFMMSIGAGGHFYWLSLILGSGIRFSVFHVSWFGLFGFRSIGFVVRVL